VPVGDDERDVAGPFVHQALPLVRVPRWRVLAENWPEDRERNQQHQRFPSPDGGENKGGRESQGADQDHPPSCHRRSSSI
jgi:hypothetical protein